MSIRKDIWRIGVVKAPILDVVQGTGLAGHEIQWLPEEPELCFAADPFAIWADGRLNLFAETYDYRTRHGRIELFVLDEQLRLEKRAVVLSEPWHLSYPFVFKAEGSVWMLPEAFRSGGLTLYSAQDFPLGWRPQARIELDCVPVDATPLFHDGLWWLFYSPASTRETKLGHLHVAWAERLTGPWTPHPQNPVRVDVGGARPGGTPVVIGDEIVLPVQDCRSTYGGAIRLLQISRLTPTEFEAELGLALTPDSRFGRYRSGLHTLADAGPVTLIDAKRQSVSLGSLAIDARRRLKL